MAEFDYPSMRRLSFEKKPRGARRRLNALGRWVESLEGWFPDDLSEEDRNWHVKVPILRGVVEGRHARRKWQVECAQHLITACEHLIRSKPESAANFRVTCLINVPDLFASEICIYIQEEFFQSHVQAQSSEYGFQKPIVGRSLASEWGLVLPPGVHERGTLWRYDASQDPDDHYVTELWSYGEVLDKPKA